MSILRQLFKPARDFFGVFAAVERRNPKVTFTLRPESGAGRYDHINFAQHPIEQLPAR
jgi:hypothetical protein